MEPTSPEARYSHLPAVVREELRRAAAEHTVTARSLLGPSRHKNVVAARLEVMRFLRQRGYSYPQIGRLFEMHHATVMHHLKDKPEPRRADIPFPDYSGEWAI